MFTARDDIVKFLFELRCYSNNCRVTILRAKDMRDYIMATLNILVAQQQIPAGGKNLCALTDSFLDVIQACEKLEAKLNTLEKTLKENA